MNTYTIRSGDTLSTIARRFGLPLHLLIEVNNIADPNKVKVGRILTLPPMTTDSTDHIETPVSAALSPTPIAINQESLRLPASGYIGEKHPKDLIVLHFTAGPSARSAFNTWIAAAARVATAYILDIDGTIYETFDPSYWAYHLGIKGAPAANHRHDKRSIGIEIVNVGPLKLTSGELFWWYPQNRFEKKWCALPDSGLYVKQSYRGFDYYAAFTQQQIQSLSPLVQMLRQRFVIPKRLPAAAQRTVADPAGYFKDFSGIASHQNFRADKFDVGPAFPWDAITL